MDYINWDFARLKETEAQLHVEINDRGGWKSERAKEELQRTRNHILFEIACRLDEIKELEDMYDERSE